MTKRMNQRGFTLIELVIIIVILGILAAVAIPKYQDLSSEAREASARSSLGSLRSGITIFYANEAVQTGTAAWPTLDEMRTYGTVMAQGIPPNPYPGTGVNASDSILDGSGMLRGATDNNGGWIYKDSTGEIWLNTNTINENTW